jgi:hypothetical protein
MSNRGILRSAKEKRDDSVVEDVEGEIGATRD